MNDNDNKTEDCICYICQCNGGELIQPCTCAGLVHPVCIQKWQNSEYNNANSNCCICAKVLLPIVYVDESVAAHTPCALITETRVDIQPMNYSSSQMNCLFVLFQPVMILVATVASLFSITTMHLQNPLIVLILMWTMVHLLHHILIRCVPEENSTTRIVYCSIVSIACIPMLYYLSPVISICMSVWLSLRMYSVEMYKFTTTRV